MKKKINPLFLLVIGLLMIAGLVFWRQEFVLITLFITAIYFFWVLEQGFMANFMPKIIAVLIILALVLWDNPKVQNGLAIFCLIMVMWIIGEAFYKNSKK